MAPVDVRWKFLPGMGLLVWVAVLLWPVNATGQDQGPYQGLKDQKMVQKLKSFPHKANRWNVPPEDGRLLYDLILENGYRRVLEVGTSNGYSALWMGLALKQTGGELITIEINEQRAREAELNLKQAGLSEVVDVRLNDALDEIPQIKGAFDMVFLDADKSQYLQYYRMLNDKISKGGAITAHNVSNMGFAMDDFLKALRGDPQYETTIRRVSSRGVLIARKIKEGEQ